MPRMFKISVLMVLFVFGGSIAAFAAPSPYGKWKGSLVMDKQVKVPSGIELEMVKNGDDRIIKRFLYPTNQDLNGKWQFTTLTGTITPTDEGAQFDLDNGASLLMVINQPEDSRLSLSWIIGNHIYELKLTRVK